MTSPLPPKRRDSVNLANLLRQDRIRLGQLDRGLVGGRFDGARPVKARTESDLEDDFDADDEIAFQNTDRATSSAAGQIILNLTYEPIDGSLHVRWNGLDQPPTDWSLAGQRVTFNDPHVHVGDVLSAAYAYYPNDVPEVVSLFDERIADGPVVYYRLGESSGTDLMDSSGNNRHGYAGYVTDCTLGVPSLDDSSTNTAVGFNGSTSDIEVVHQTWMDLTQISVVALTKPNAVNGRTIAARDNNGTSGPWRLDYDATGHPRFLVWVGGVVKIAVGSSPVATGVRHDIAGTFDGGTVRVYVDGTEVGSTAATGALDTNLSQTLSIGRHNEAGTVFDGTLDEFAMYDHQVSAQRLLAHAQAAGVA